MFIPKNESQLFNKIRCENYYEFNKDEVKQRAKDWCEAHKSERQIYQHEYREEIINDLEGVIPARLREE